MKRYSKNKSSIAPPPVESVEVSTRHVRLRTVLLVAFVAVAIACFAVVLVSLLKVDAGWTTLKEDTTLASCGDDFVFSYYFEEKQDKHYRQGVADKYTNACVYAYNVFCDYEQLGGLNNLFYLNAHPNEELEVPSLLYRAIEAFETSGSRFLYYAPIYDCYNALFTMTSDANAALCDPSKNSALKAYVDNILPFVKDENHVRIELLGDNRLKLVVSEKYQAAFGDNARVYIDFLWTKNAFIIDYIADTMLTSGLSRGIISSYDGFTRNLCETQEVFSANIFDLATDDNGSSLVLGAGTMSYSQRLSVVMLKSYPVSGNEYGYYTYEDGSVRSRFISPESGENISAISTYTAFSRSKSCAQIALEIIPLYLSDELSLEKIAELKSEGVYSLYCENGAIKTNSDELVITPLERESGTYSVELF